MLSVDETSASHLRPASPAYVTPYQLIVDSDPEDVEPRSDVQTTNHLGAPDTSNVSYVSRIFYLATSADQLC